MNVLTRFVTRFPPMAQRDMREGEVAQRFGPLAQRLEQRTHNPVRAWPFSASLGLTRPFHEWLADKPSQAVQASPSGTELQSHGLSHGGASARREAGWVSARFKPAEYAVGVSHEVSHEAQHPPAGSGLVSLPIRHRALRDLQGTGELRLGEANSASNAADAVAKAGHRAGKLQIARSEAMPGRDTVSATSFARAYPVKG